MGGHEGDRALVSGGLRKARTGIAGLDEITKGGLPAGRTTLVCGGPGCGKTVLGMEFLVRGALNDGDPGLFVSFEEDITDLDENFASFGFDLQKLKEQQMLHVLQLQLHPDELLEAGDFSLDGLFIRLELAIAKIGAKRVVLDTLETLFARITNVGIMRREIARLFGWLKDKGLTSIVTGEKGAMELTRHGLEEYVSDCILFLDHRIDVNVSKRRLRVVKYRGSPHGADEYPFLIGTSGLSVFPISSVALSDMPSSERVSSGVHDLDAMLENKGYYRGSSVLVTGTAGTGKSSLAASFARSSIERGEKCLYLAFEEPAAQIVRNMQSVSIDLGPGIDSGLLRIQAHRPTLYGLEEHLVVIMDEVKRFQPDVVVMDPITNFVSIGGTAEIKSMLTRVFDHFKSRGILALCTSLTSGSSVAEETHSRVASLMDCWIVLTHSFDGPHRVRRLYVAKSRGMQHALDSRELVISSQGLTLQALPSKEAEAMVQQ